MAWWIWLIAGIGLLAAEVATPGMFVSLFFGLGAMAVAVLVGLDVGGPDWLQWVLFPILSLLLLAAFRQTLLGRMGTTRKVQNLVGEAAVALEDIPMHGRGKVELRGTTWSAENLSDYKLSRGQACRVEAVNGITVSVRPD